MVRITRIRSIEEVESECFSAVLSMVYHHQAFITTVVLNVAGETGELKHFKASNGLT